MSDTPEPIFEQLVLPGFEDEETDEQPAAPVFDAPERIDCETAFIVYQHADGSFVADSDINLPLVPKREATPRDFRRACDEVVHDINVRTTVNELMAAQMQMAHRVAQAQQTDQLLRAQMGGPQGLDLTSLRNR